MTEAKDYLDFLEQHRLMDDAQKYPLVVEYARSCEAEIARLRAFWDEMRAFRDWANVQFPNSTPQSKAHHLAKEAHAINEELFEGITGEEAPEFHVRPEAVS